MDYKTSRKRFVVKPGFQLKTALTLTLYITAYSLVFGAVIFYPLYHELNSAVTVEDRANLSSMILYLHKRIWPGLFAVALLAGIQSIFASHRIAGPMYRFEKMANDLLRGNYGARIRTRKGDEFNDMTRLLNDLASDLEITRTRHAEISADMRTRLETVSAMLEAEGAAYPNDVKMIIQTLVAELTYRTKVS